MVRMECWWQVESKFDAISNSLTSVGSDVVMVHGCMVVRELI
jgi:hypothetical protein